MSNVLELTPPLIIGKAEIDYAIDVLGQALDDVENNRVPDEVLAGFQGW